MVMSDTISIITCQLLATKESIRNFSVEDEKYISLEELEISLKYLNERLSYEIENS